MNEIATMERGERGEEAPAESLIDGNQFFPSPGKPLLPSRQQLLNYGQI